MKMLYSIRSTYVNKSYLKICLVFWNFFLYVFLSFSHTKEHVIETKIAPEHKNKNENKAKSKKGDFVYSFGLIWC